MEYGCFYLILFIIGIWIFVLLNKDKIEEFASIVTIRKYKVEATFMHPITYSKCIGMPTTDTRLNDAPFYVKSFINVKYNLKQIARLLQGEVSTLDRPRIAAILINTNTTSNYKQNIYFLFPEFDYDGNRVESYALIAKNNRWYYLLMYNLFYNTGNGICGSENNFGVCPGTFIRVRSTNYFLVRYIDYYITPCGASDVSGLINPMIPYIDQSKVYAHYLPKKSVVPGITPYPNLEYMSQFDTIKYGCDSQLVSENRRFLLLLDQPTRRFGVYRVTRGNIYDFCAAGSFPFKKPVWTIPLSKRSRLYATFKIEENYIVLIDFDRPIFKITIPTKNTPIVLKLTNKGEFEIYDSTNNFLRTITYQDILDAIRGKPVSYIEMDLDSIRNNLSEDDRRRRELEDRARIAELDAAADYNRRCPIGS